MTTELNIIERTARFYGLLYEGHYDIVSGDSGHWITRGIQGGDALRASWMVGDEAWPAGELTFAGEPVSIAEEEL